MFAAKLVEGGGEMLSFVAVRPANKSHLFIAPKILVVAKLRAHRGLGTRHGQTHLNWMTLKSLTYRDVEILVILSPLLISDMLSLSKVAESSER